MAYVFVQPTVKLFPDMDMPSWAERSGGFILCSSSLEAMRLGGEITAHLVEEWFANPVGEPCIVPVETFAIFPESWSLSMPHCAGITCVNEAYTAKAKAYLQGRGDLDTLYLNTPFAAYDDFLQALADFMLERFPAESEWRPLSGLLR